MPWRGYRAFFNSDRVPTNMDFIDFIVISKKKKESHSVESLVARPSKIPATHTTVAETLKTRKKISLIGMRTLHPRVRVLHFEIIQSKDLSFLACQVLMMLWLRETTLHPGVIQATVLFFLTL